MRDACSTERGFRIEESQVGKKIADELALLQKDLWGCAAALSGRSDFEKGFFE